MCHNLAMFQDCIHVVNVLLIICKTIALTKGIVVGKLCLKGAIVNNLAVLEVIVIRHTVIDFLAWNTHCDGMLR